MAAAELNVRREVEETIKRMQIRNAEFPGLARLALDSKDLRKTVDDLGVSFSNNFDNAFADAITRVDTLDSALRKLATGGLRDLASAMSKRFITGPLAEGFGSFLKTGLSAIGFAEGGIMTPHGPLPLRKYARGGVANSPQVSVWAEGKLPEAMVPLPDGRTIPVTIKGGTGSNVSFAPVMHITVGPGTDPNEFAFAMERRLEALSAVVMKQGRAIQKMPEAIAATSEFRPGMKR
jgi:hypothetical protein